MAPARARADAPEGASLEGFLWPANYRVLPDTTPEELLRKMLDGFHEAVGDDKMKVPAERGLSFYQVLSARLDRRTRGRGSTRSGRSSPASTRTGLNGIPGIKNKILNADPTVIYANDTVQLDALDFEKWQDYRFWTVPEASLSGTCRCPRS